jgi:hypothetical protein
LSDFTEKYYKAKKRDLELRSGERETLDPVARQEQNDKMDYLFTVNVSKKINDYDIRQDLITDFKEMTLSEKRAFLIKEYGVNPDLSPDPKPGELKASLQPHDEKKRDLKTPVCRMCGKQHNPFEPCPSPMRTPSRH